MDWRKDFPIFEHHPQWLYADSAATTQKPRVLLDAERQVYETIYSNIHRGFDRIAQKATDAFETVRHQVAEFIGAASSDDIVFTRNATESLNLAAWMEGQRLQEGDEIITTVAEHHSNVLPWRRVAEKTGARLIIIHPRDDGRLHAEDISAAITKRTQVVTLAHVSNVLGYIAPLSDIIALAHDAGARVVIDTAQSAGRMPLNVQALDVDYAAFSGHKMYGPTGVGFLYAKRPYWEQAEPLLLGGGTVHAVTQNTVQWHKPPWKFEAGTPHIAGVIAFGATLTYLTQLTWENIQHHEHEITAYALDQLQAIPELTVYGPHDPSHRSAIVSFLLSSGGNRIHPHDVASYADTFHIALRGGHHCAGPLMEFLQVPALNRISFGIYNSRNDVDRIVTALKATQKRFHKR